MTISVTVKQHLDDRGIDYDVIKHDPTGGSMETAHAAHVSGESMAKAVVLKDHDGYLLAVMPATYKLTVGEVYDVLGRHLELAREEELSKLFEDCVLGAVPPLGDAYGLETVWDDSLASLKDVYFEGGDHGSLVRVAGDDFRKLMGEAKHATFSHHV